MKRWLIAWSVIVLAGVLLAGLARRSEQAATQLPLDEILAYEISNEQTVVVAIPGDVPRLSVTSWAVVQPLSEYDPLAKYDYALAVTAWDAQGNSVAERTYFQESRVSAPELDGRSEAPFVARLADSHDWITDPRTTEVDLAELRGAGGRVRIASAGKRRILVRIAFSEARSQLEQHVLARSLDAPKRRLLVEGRASLGFGDLPLPAQERALARWGRRIGALGRKGQDYVERRLLLGLFRAPPEPWRARDLGADIDPQHAAALNMEGAVVLHVISDRNGDLTIADGYDPAQVVRVSAGARASIALRGSTLRTVIVRSSTQVHVRFHVEQNDRSRQVGDFPYQAAQDGKVEIGPDVRRQRYFRMDPSEPLRIHLARGQQMLGLTVRRLCGGADSEPKALVTARWSVNGQVHSARAELILTRSDFDHFPGLADASEASWLQFQAPVGATEVELTGPVELAATVWTREPMVSVSVIHPAYARPLAPEETFRNAPHDLRTWAPLIPDNEEALTLAGRTLFGTAQVRIQNRALSSAGQTLPERALLPEGAPPRRELLIPGKIAAGSPLPPATWAPVVGATALRIEHQGENAGRLMVRFRLGTQPLGGMLSLSVDGNRIHEQPLLLESGTIEQPLAAGTHLVTLDGLLEGSEAYAQAAPAKGGAIVKS